MKRPLCVAFVTSLTLLHPTVASFAEPPARNPFDGRPAGAPVATVAIEVTERSRLSSTLDAFFVQPETCRYSSDCGPRYCDAYYGCLANSYACVASPRTGVAECVYLATCPTCQPFAPTLRPGRPGIP